MHVAEFRHLLCIPAHLHRSLDNLKDLEGTVLLSPVPGEGGTRVGNRGRGKPPGLYLYPVPFAKSYVILKHFHPGSSFQLCSTLYFPQL